MLKRILRLPLITWFALLQASALAAPPAPLLLTIGPDQANANSYSSRPLTSVQTIDGAQVVLQRERGVDYRVQGGEKTWTWFQIEQVPAQESYLAITPLLQGDTVTLEVEYHERQGDQATHFNSTLHGAIGNWITLFDAGHQGARVKPQGSYSSSKYTSAAADALAIRVDRVP